MRLIFLLLIVVCYLPGIARPVSKKTNEADSIIKGVIEKNKPDKKLSLQADAYIKNVLVLNKAPKRFLGKKVTELLKLKSNTRQVLYLYESNSDLYFLPSGLIKEDVKAFKTIGKFEYWEFKKAADLQLNFNQDYEELEGFSDKKFVSPIAKNAFNFYNYSLVNTLLDSLGNKTDVIKIIPKNKFSPTYNGYIYVNSISQQVSKLSLTLGNNAGISFINSLTIEQNLIKIDSVYYPTKTTITYDGDILGFSYHGNCTGTFKYQENNKNKINSFKPHEILKIPKPTDFQADTIENIRTIPLTPLENSTYFNHDSLKSQQSEKSYLDSLDRLTLKERLYPFLFSRFKIRNTYRRYLFEFDAIAPALFYNTVEGPGVKYGINYTKYRDNGGYFFIRPEIRYGFKNQELNSDISFSWLYSPENRAVLNLSFGNTFRDLNPNGSLNSLNNSLNTLLFEQNFMKLYRKEYVSISSGREISNGLYFSGGWELSRNTSAFNNYDFSLRNIRRRNFTSNNPLDPLLSSQLFPNHTTLRVSGTLIYTFNHNYITREGIKIYEIPKNPRLILSYRKGIPNVLHSNSDYDYVEFELQQEKLNMGLWGYSSFSISTGKFFRNVTNFYPDWKHFSGNNALIFNPGLKSFHFLDFYAFSTDKGFIEAHYEQNFNCKFFGAVPLLRKLKLQELMGGAFLTHPDRGSYYEAYFGVKRLTFRADYAMSFNDDGLINQGFKISLRF